MLPQEFLDRMKEMLGEEFEEFVSGLEGKPYQALRFNSLKKKEGDIFFPFHLTKVPWEKNGYYYQEGDYPGKHVYHAAGVYYIQEPSAMAPVALLKVKPGERVLDLCAAPGGKSTQIAAALNGEGFLLCNEIHPARAKILSENIERMGVSNAIVTNELPKRLSEVFLEYFDCILVDAPCSGEGMFRKNEEACTEWSLENVQLCAERQDEILQCAAKMLRPGGRMMYSTCTFAPLENEGSVSRFLKSHHDFELLPLEKSILSQDKTESKNLSEVPKISQNKQEVCFGGGIAKWVENPAEHLEYTLRLWPHRVNGEGHFAALLHKKKKNEDRIFYESCCKNGIEKGIAKKDLREYLEFCQQVFTKEAMERYFHQASFVRFGDYLFLIPKDMPNLKGLKVLRAGLELGMIKKNRFEPSHALALALSSKDVFRVWNLSSKENSISEYLKGQTFCAEGEKGWYLICADGYSIGWGKLAGNVMKNHYPKGLRRNF